MPAATARKVLRGCSVVLRQADGYAVPALAPADRHPRLGTEQCGTCPRPTRQLSFSEEAEP